MLNVTEAALAPAPRRADFERRVYGFSGPKLDEMVAIGLRRILAAHAEAGGAGSGPVTLPISLPVRAAGSHLVATQGIRADGKVGTLHFPVLTRCLQDEERGTVVVELHPEMRVPEAARDLMAAMLGGGRVASLLTYLWGRWGQTLVVPMEDLMAACGAGHLRTTQFKEELDVASHALEAVAGFGYAVDYEREGRGGKVARVILKVGAPEWMPSAQPVATEAGGAGPAGVGPDDALPPVPGHDRAIFYGLLARLCENGVTLPKAAQFAATRLATRGGPAAALADRLANALAAGMQLGPWLALMIPPAEAEVITQACLGADLAAGLEAAALFASEPRGNDAQARALAYVSVSAMARGGTPFAKACEVMGAAFRAEVAAGYLAPGPGAAAASVFSAISAWCGGDRAPAGALPGDEGIYLPVIMEGCDVERGMLAMATLASIAGRSATPGDCRGRWLAYSGIRPRLALQG